MKKVDERIIRPTVEGWQLKGSIIKDLSSSV